jgi:CheY-like chemotaxis protein
MADVLVVDDDVDLARTIADVFGLLGHSVRTAANGGEGLAAVAERKPDLIFLDIEMPVLDGPAMAYQLMVRDAGQELIPIVLSSGYAGLASIADGLGTLTS